MMTLGRLRYAEDAGGKGFWCVDRLQPHVAMAFKRIFTKVRANLAVLVVTDTDDVRADLEWFMVRYPLETREQARLAEGSARVRRRAADMQTILSLKWRPGPLTYSQVKYPPYFYQEQAAALALQNGSLLLVDDVGLGKTETSLLAVVRGAPMPVALVVESHLVRQWVRRIQKFTFLRAHAIKTTAPYRLPEADVYVFSYAKQVGWTEHFDRGLFKSAIWDEIQELRHGATTKKGNAALVLANAAEFRMGLTATPIYNYGDEMHTIMSYIQPDLLGSREEFWREWTGGEKGVRDPDALGSYLQTTGHYLRRAEDDTVVDKSLPPMNTIDVELDFDEVAVAEEEKLLRTLATSVLTGRFEESGQAARELDVRMRHITGVAKAKSVALYVEMLLRDREKVALAGWHRDVYDIWLERLARFNPVLYTGSETAAAKDRNATRFIEGDSRVFIMSNRSGKGLDGLQAVCHEAVVGELDFSPAVHKQFFGRVRRPGQLHQVTGHYLHVNGGSDPVLMQLLGRKSDQSRGILDPGKAPAQRYTDESRIKALARFVLAGG